MNKNIDAPKKHKIFFIFIFVMIWIGSIVFLTFSVITKPNLFIFFAWNAAVQQDRQAVDFYAKKLQKSSAPSYQKAGEYYVILSDVMKKGISRSDIKLTIDNKKDWALIKQKINKAFQKLNVNKMNDKMYYRHLREILAWIYFHEANYVAATNLYLDLLIENENDAAARYNYEVALLLKNSAISENAKNATANSVSEENQDTEIDVLSLFKIQESDSYHLFEVQETDKQLPNY